MVFGLLLFVGAILFAGPVVAAKQSGAVADAELKVIGELRTGQPVTVLFDLKGYEIPKGSYSSINVRFLAEPEGPEPKVKTGYPRTTLFFLIPGIYRITFILNEVSKPSCGGVNAKTLLENTIELQIAE